MQELMNSIVTRFTQLNVMNFLSKTNITRGKINIYCKLYWLDYVEVFTLYACLKRVRINKVNVITFHLYFHLISCLRNKIGLTKLCMKLKFYNTLFVNYKNVNITLN